jgi:hypothetical protein
MTAGDERKAIRERRARATRKYQPRDLELLLVAESPPKAPDRHFYFEDVRQHDLLFRYVAKGILGDMPTRENKAEVLSALKDKGVFMIELRSDPIDDTPVDDYVPDLLRRVRRLEPRKIVLIKARVFDAAYEPLRDDGQPVVDVRVPFPGRGQQAHFEKAFADALRTGPVRVSARAGP